jgi:hypothetical protein
MMRHRTIFLAALALALAIRPARAQDDWWWSASWSVAPVASLPLAAGSSAEFLDGSSLRGLSVEGHRLPRPDSRWSIGFSVGWQAWDGESSEPVPVGGSVVSGRHLRYQNVFPVLAIGRLYARGPAALRPWLGLGAGGYVIERRVETGPVRIEDTPWHAGLAPEAGLLIPIAGDAWAAVAGVRYNWVFSASGRGEQSWVALSLGVAYR